MCRSVSRQGSPRTRRAPLLFLFPLLLFGAVFIDRSEESVAETGELPTLAERVLRIRPPRLSELPPLYADSVLKSLQANRYRSLALVVTRADLEDLAKGRGLAPFVSEGTELFVLALLEDFEGLEAKRIAGLLSEVRDGSSGGSGSKGSVVIGLAITDSCSRERATQVLTELVVRSAVEPDAEARYEVFVDGWRWGREPLAALVSSERATSVRVAVSIPFSGDSMLVSETAIGVDASFFGDAKASDAEAALIQEDQLQVLFLLENGAQRVLPWCDPTFVRGVVGSIRGHQARGVVLGTRWPEFSGIPLRIDVPKESLAKKSSSKKNKKNKNKKNKGKSKNDEGVAPDDKGVLSDDKGVAPDDTPTAGNSVVDVPSSEAQEREEKPVRVPFNFERRWEFHRVWGHLFYDVSLEDEFFEAEYVSRFGKHYGRKLFRATMLASRFHPPLYRLHSEATSSRFYVEGSISSREDEIDADWGWYDQRPYRGILEFAFHRATDPKVLSPIEYAAYMLKKKGPVPRESQTRGLPKTVDHPDVTPEGQETPYSILAKVGRPAGESRNIVDPIVYDLTDKPSPMVRSYATDVLGLANLGLHYSAKIRGACEFSLSIAGFGRQHRRLRGTYSHQAVAWWKYVTWDTNRRLAPFDVEAKSSYHWDQMMADIVVQETMMKKQIVDDPDGFELLAPYVSAPPLGQGYDFSLVQGLLDLGIDGFDEPASSWSPHQTSTMMEAEEFHGQWRLVDGREEAFGSCFRRSPSSSSKDGSDDGSISAGGGGPRLVRRVTVEEPVEARFFLRVSSDATPRIRMVVSRGLFDEAPVELTAEAPGVGSNGFSWLELGGARFAQGAYVVEISHSGDSSLEFDAIFVATQSGVLPPKSK